MQRIKAIIRQIEHDYNEYSFGSIYLLLDANASMRVGDQTIMGAIKIVKYLKNMRYQSNKSLRVESANIKGRFIQYFAIAMVPK